MGWVYLLEIVMATNEVLFDRRDVQVAFDNEQLLGNLITPFIEKGTEALVARAKELVPHEWEWNPGPYRRATGIQMKNTIDTSIPTREPNGRFMTLVGHVVVNHPAALYVINGTAGHWISSKNFRSWLRFPIDGGATLVYKRKVYHKSTKPDNFLQRALQDVIDSYK